jgi:exonuclease SbcC
MLDIKQKSKIHVHWKVSPYDYSKEKEREIIEKFSKKYGIPKERVKVIQELIIKNDEGDDISINEEIIQNIQDPQFQLKLYSDYLKLNNITDYDFDLIKKIDSEINQKIDYQIYDKYKRYSIKWIKWSNFLSYGENNFFDFTKLGKIALLSSTPSNQGGKTTFCIDLLRFLLFGSTTKYKTQNKFFNKHIPSATNVVVEGCINIDGVDYIIKRTLSRPQLGKRTASSKTSQKVEYYKIVGNSQQELEDYVENKEEENTRETNKVIKEAIGKESDFELIMCVTGKSLDELVDKKETERGRLLARWIGLLPIEEKDVLAREKYNSEVKPFLLSNQYNAETLSNEIQAFEVVNKSLNEDIKKFKKEIKEIEKEISTMEKTKETLLQSKKSIDQNLIKVDITTLNSKIEDSIVEGKRKNKEVEEINAELEKIGEVDFSVEEYDKIQAWLVKASGERSVIGEQYKNIKANIQHLKTSEICPTCGRKLDNVDNSKKIKELEEELERVEKLGKEKKAEIESLEKKIESLKDSREKYNKKSQLIMKKSALELNVEKLRNEYRENAALKKEYDANSEAIDKNNAIDIQIRNNDVLLTNKRTVKENNLSYITRNESEIKSNNEKIEQRKDLIKKINEEEKLVKNWKIYLEMVGKNGISKMVLRKALPIINARLSQLLFDVCDFGVEVVIDGKNDVLFYLVKDGVYSDLNGGSGFELTAAALALRAVLAEMSTIPRMNILVLDEVFGRVAKENYDNIKTLLDKIGKNYDVLINITHLDEFKDYCDSHIVVKKKDNISTIQLDDGKNNSLQFE